MRNRLHGSEIYLVNVKTIRQIAQIFVAFSEKLNFTVLLVVSAATFSFHIYAMSAAKWGKVPHLFDIFLLTIPIFVMHIKFKLHNSKSHYCEIL